MRAFADPLRQRRDLISIKRRAFRWHDFVFVL